MLRFGFVFGLIIFYKPLVWRKINTIGQIYVTKTPAKRKPTVYTQRSFTLWLHTFSCLMVFVLISSDTDENQICLLYLQQSSSVDGWLCMIFYILVKNNSWEELIKIVEWERRETGENDTPQYREGKKLSAN